jgi:hypothetical protein
MAKLLMEPERMATRLSLALILHRLPQPRLQVSKNIRRKKEYGNLIEVAVLFFYSPGGVLTLLIG